METSRIPAKATDRAPNVISIDMKPTVYPPLVRKKPYVPPRLTRYGRFTDIVQGKGGVKQEPGGKQAGPRSRA